MTRDELALHARGMYPQCRVDEMLDSQVVAPLFDAESFGNGYGDGNGDGYGYGYGDGYGYGNGDGYGDGYGDG